MRLTYAQLKTRLIGASGLGPNHRDLLGLVNEACEILHNEAEYVGKRVKFQIKITQDCCGVSQIVWPRHLETIEQAAFCDRPIHVRDFHYEFVQDGLGVLDYQKYSDHLVDRGETCTVSEFTGNQKLKVYARRSEGVNAYLHAFGFDHNNEWVRSQDINGVWYDGEKIPVNLITPQVSFAKFSKVTAIQKSETNGNVLLYSVDDDLIETYLGTYEYDETVPVFRKSAIVSRGSSSTMIVGGLRRFIPVARDTDYVYPPYAPAIGVMIKALSKRDSETVDAYMVLKQDAINLVRMQMKNYKGLAPQSSIRFENSEAFAPSAAVI